MQNVRRRTGTAEPARESSRSRGRGRPRAFDRQVALDAAMRLFWRKGFSATSISDLTDAMGIGSPSLYAAFGSKEQLYAEALQHFSETAPEIWLSLDEGPTARDAMERFLLASAAALPATGDHPGGCMLTLSSVAAEGCEKLGELVCAGRAEVLRRVEDRIRRGVEAGELPAGTDISALARYILAVQQGMSIQARDGATREQLEPIARAAMGAWPA